MGPIVESVLGSLTQEYENRLQSKDHEVSAAQHEVRAAHTALKKAQEELYEMHKAVAENSNLLPVCSAQPGVLTDYPSPLAKFTGQLRRGLEQEVLPVHCK